MSIKAFRDSENRAISGFALPYFYPSTAIEAVEIRLFLELSFRAFWKQIEEKSIVREAGIRGQSHPDTSWWCREMPTVLSQCDTILWERDMWDLALRGNESLVGSMPDPHALLSPNSILADEEIRPQLWLVRGALWSVTDQEMIFARVVLPDLRRDDHRPVMWCVEIIASHQSSNDNKANYLMIDSYFVDLQQPLGPNDTARIAAAAFLNLSVSETIEETLPRQFRRRMQRKERSLPPVYTVRLRRSVGKHTHHESTQRTFHCHWLNGAHWRNQWYPSKGEHRPKFIAAYVKGDRSKPFRQPSEKVFRVAR